MRSARTQAARLAALVAIGLLAVQTAHAGVVVTYQHTSAGKSAPETGKLWLTDDRFRMETGAHVMIFRADKDLFWIVDEKNGKYTEMDRETMKKMGDQVSAAMAQMQEQLKNMPPEQRQMMEKMMSGKMGAGMPGTKREPLTWQKTDEEETIAGYPCRRYDGMRGEEREQEAWITAWDKLGLTASDFAVMDKFVEFMKEITGPMSQMVSTGFVTKYGEGDDALPGVPVKTVRYTHGGQSVDEFKSVERKTPDASVFEVPAGLKKETMDAATMRQGRGGS